MEDILVFIQEQWWLVAALAILIGLLVRHESVAAGPKLSLSQVVQAMNSDQAVLVDVRESREFASGHVANAINIPHKKINDNFNLLDKHREKQIIITDGTGQYSGTVSRILAKKDYNVARMSGGMAEWTHENLPLVK